jgi:tetratricopeptide (TPR) repeat protein
LDKDEKAKENYRSAVEIYNKIGTESIKCPYKLQNIGRMHYQQNEKTKALEYYQRALAIYEKIGKESIGWAQTLYNIGPVYKNQNRVK